MDRIVLKDGTLIQFGSALGINFFGDVDKTFEELESILSTDNLSNIKITNSEGEIYGEYANLELVSITKNFIYNNISISLKEVTQ